MTLPKPDIAYIPCQQEIVEAVLELAQINSEDIFYDLGSGDGRILITAAKKYGTRGIGIDIDPKRIEQAKQKALKTSVGGKLEFYQQDLFSSNYADATVIFIYLLPHLNLRLRPQLWQQLKPGTRIVSRDFDMGNWKPLKQVTLTVKEEAEEEQVTLYYWEIGNH
ncbi:methylase involved in ubiquinone/menaquinone biosynthesis [Rivularia sp. PCC 7116]|uniref:class I SAM-dependent methyltransferase n=1 Tax=Rivularia sp. PCC 7116 TaxID=373994 RepID=UPI00029F1427|nr:class I SAM-dependent methyltransferase [Rivularia sp. PCC 7116]AFY58128.1 methylase involved in ubiquinone/menaquinone biosynthesis [Rivularia sp. PCC 7116]